MREIKFRAWDKKSNCFYLNVQNHVGNEDTSFGYMLKNDRYVIQQYTGLKDRNNVEIYDGDILKVDEHNTYGGKYVAPVKWIDYENEGDSWAFWGVVCCDCKGEPVYNDRVTSLLTRGFLTRTFGSCISLPEMTRTRDFIIEVIGNIYENPELIEDA